MYKIVLLLCVTLVICDARPWQYLPAKEGYIPVYVVVGDTSLDQINPELAEAFGVIPSGRSAPGSNDILAEKDSNEVNDDLTLGQEENLKNGSVETPEDSLIRSGDKQKIYSFGVEKDSNIQKIATPKEV